MDIYCKSSKSKDKYISREKDAIMACFIHVLLSNLYKSLLPILDQPNSPNITLANCIKKEVIQKINRRIVRVNFSNGHMKLYSIITAAQQLYPNQFCIFTLMDVSIWVKVLNDLKLEPCLMDKVDPSLPYDDRIYIFPLPLPFHDNLKSPMVIIDGTNLHRSTHSRFLESNMIIINDDRKCSSISLQYSKLDIPYQIFSNIINQHEHKSESIYDQIIEKMEFVIHPKLKRELYYGINFNNILISHLAYMLGTWNSGNQWLSKKMAHLQIIKKRNIYISTTNSGARYHRKCYTMLKFLLKNINFIDSTEERRNQILCNLIINNSKSKIIIVSHKKEYISQILDTMDIPYILIKEAPTICFSSTTLNAMKHVSSVNFDDANLIIAYGYMSPIDRDIIYRKVDTANRTKECAIHYIY